MDHRAVLLGGCFSIKVLLADDSDVMRRAIVKLLNEEPSTELVGEAKRFAETIQLANEFRPDVLVMDLHMSESGRYISQERTPLLGNRGDSSLAQCTK